ncbi:MAG: cation diffusion facilitator family transporter [Flavobacteriales bacterium]
MHQISHHHEHRHEGRARIVVILTAAVMVAEITVGMYSNSMALMADGWHMGAHVLAIGITWFAYVFTRKNRGNLIPAQRTDKVFSLAGYTSSVILLIVALLITVKAIEHLYNPEAIQFKTALIVAFTGLLVNGASAAILHHKKEQRDYNIYAAYLHVLADVVTSLAAIVALGLGLWLGISWLDPLSGIISSLIIGKWAIQLALKSGRELITG